MTSPHAPRRLVIATRESALAMWRARHIQTRLQALYPRASVELLGMTAQGDRTADRSHASFPAKSSLIREIEAALGEGRADLAVHSLKDVPIEVGDGFALAAIEARDDPRDALVSMRYTQLRALPSSAVVATASPCCEVQLRERYPSLHVRRLPIAASEPLRDLRDGHCDAMILAASDARCLGLGDFVGELIDPAESLPAAGQGMLAIECRADRPDVIAAVTPLNDTATLLAAIAERAFARALAGGSETPLAAHATWQEGSLWLRGLIATPDGRHVIRGEREHEVVDEADAEALGAGLADELLTHGAGRLIVND